MHKSLAGKLTLFFIFAFAACATPAKNNLHSIDYSDKSAVLYEVSRAEKLIKTKPLDALAKAVVLDTKTTGYEEVTGLYNDAKIACESAFDQAVEKGDWQKALVYFRSLCSVGLAPAGWTEQLIQQKQLIQWQHAGRDALVNAAKKTVPDGMHIAPSDKKLEQLLKGTVTVWVDRGMSVQRGVGYANRVIGSGFFIDKQGYFLTNYHVIQSDVDPKYEGYSRVFIRDPNNPTIRIPAKVIGWDAILDIALVKTELTPEFVFQFGSSADLNVGSKIYAIGSPAGLEKTLTSGIVSAKNRRLLSLGSVLQIDAAVNHGNSGGPLIDERGNVQAVVFAGLEQNEGLNFAIPIELVKSILPELFAGGAVTHGWFGNFGHSLLPDENKTVEKGVVVDYILPQSAADEGQMYEGDIITKISGISVNSVEDIQDLIFDTAAGTILKVEGYTMDSNLLAVPGTDVLDKKYVPQTWFIQLGERPELPGKEAYKNDVLSRVMFPLTGMQLEKISGKSYRIKSIIKGSSADEIGFSKDDYVELKGEHLDEEQDVLFMQVYAKRRSQGYLEGFLGLYAYLDDPGYF